MRKGGFTAVEAVGMVITALASQAMIRGLLDPDTELWWGILGWVPGGTAGQMAFLALIALVAVVSGGWAHLRQERQPHARQDADSDRYHGQEAA